MLDTMAGICGYTEIQCIWSKSGYNEIQSFLKSMNLALDTIRYNVSGPSLDTMDTNLTSRLETPHGPLTPEKRTGEEKHICCND